MKSIVMDKNRCNNGNFIFKLYVNDLFFFNFIM